MRAVLNGARNSLFKHQLICRKGGMKKNVLHISLQAILSPAAIPNVPRFYLSIEGGGRKMAVFKKDTAGDSITAAQQGFHLLFCSFMTIGHL